MRKDTETALMQFVYHNLKGASDLEVRLTVYLIVILGYCPEHWCFIFKEELISGQEFFDCAGKRIYQIDGLGFSDTELIKAIREVNKRGLLIIKTKAEGALIIKLNLKYLKNALSKEFPFVEPISQLS